MSDLDAARDDYMAVNDVHLRTFLQLAVPVAMMDLAHEDAGVIASVASANGAVVTEKGDVIQFHSSGTGSAAASLARGLAAAAILAQGGINFAGLHWCSDHRVCKSVEELQS